MQVPHARATSRELERDAAEEHQVQPDEDPDQRRHGEEHRAERDAHDERTEGDALPRPPAGSGGLVG